MRSESPPGRGGARAHNLAAAVNKTKKTICRVRRSRPQIKVLLDHAGAVWLFEIREVDRSHYSVEVEDHVWKFSLLWSAQCKFERELKRHSGQGMRIARHRSQSAISEGSPTERASDGEQ